MDIKTKHRIIGIVVLVALAVIIIPLFFGRSPEKGPRLASNIPNAPSKPEVQLAIPPASPSDGNAMTSPVARQASELAVQPLQPANASGTPGTNIAPAAEEASDTTTATPEANSTTIIPAAAPVAPKAIPKTHPHEMPRTKTGKPKIKFAKHHSETKLAAAGQAWTVQLASFSQRANAQQLIKELRAKGFAAYLHEAKTRENLVCRVFVGPELNREKANSLVQKLHSKFHLKGVVVKYRV